MAGRTTLPVTDQNDLVVFAKAVLEFHAVYVYPALNREMCRCGRRTNECPIQTLARRIGVEVPKKIRA